LLPPSPLGLAQRFGSARLKHLANQVYVWLWDAISLSDINTVIQDWHSYLDMASSPKNKGGFLNTNGPVQNVLFDPKWIPVANDNGIPICLDMNPLPSGVKGQIVYVDWEDGAVTVIANSFIDFLEQGLCKMKNE